MSLYAIPDNRRPPSWEPGVVTGVIGGIPARTNLINVTLAPYFADKTGTVDAGGPIQTAINNAPDEAVIYCPTGTYLLNNLTSGRSNITIMGDGCGEPGEVGLTTFKLSAAQPAFIIGNDPNYENPFSPHSTIVGGATRGSTSITVSNAANFVGDRTGMIKVPNDVTIPVVSFYSQPELRFWCIKITNVDVPNNILTIFPPLPCDLSSISGIRVLGQNPATTYLNRVGIESLVVDVNGLAPYAAVKYDANTVQCWVKNVSVINNFGNYAIAFSETVNSEINHCKITHGVQATSHSGVLMNTTTNNLIVDSIFVDIYSAILGQQGGIGLCQLYNFFNANLFGANITTNHGPFPMFGLIEGNIVPKIDSDGYFGGEGWLTMFRNWATAVIDFPNPGDIQGAAFFFQRYCRYFNVVGNIVFDAAHDWSFANTGGLSLGFPFGGFFAGHSSLLHNIPDQDWDLSIGGPRNYSGIISTVNPDGISGTIILDAGKAAQFLSRVMPPGETIFDTPMGADRVKFLTIIGIVGNTATFNDSSDPIPAPGTPIAIWGGPRGFVTIDDDVEATLLLVDNFDFKSHSIPPAQALPAGVTLPNSLAYTSAPAFFSGFTWPPFDPSNPNGLSASLIPAGFRYYLTLPPVIQNAVVDPSGNTITITLNKPVTLGAGGTGGFTTGVGLTFNSIVGSSLVYNTSRTIVSSESLDLTYVAPGPPFGFVDSNGNGLQSKSAFAVSNNSHQTGSNVIYWAADPDDCNGTFQLEGQGRSKVAFINVIQNGIAVHVPIFIQTNLFNAQIKIGVYNQFNALVSSFTGTVTKTGEKQFFNIPSFVISDAPSTYKILIESNQNNDPTIKILTGQTAGSTKEEFTPYVDVPPDPLGALFGSFTYKMGVGLEIVPSPDSHLIVSGTLSITGNLKLS